MSKNNILESWNQIVMMTMNSQISIDLLIASISNCIIMLIIIIYTSSIVNNLTDPRKQALLLYH